MASQCLLSAASVTAATGPYDQLIIEADSGTRHLFGLKAGSALEILGTDDLLVDKTIATTMQSISSGALNRLAGRMDTATAPDVSTTLTMEAYS
jgi:hypothetical protein